jgi:hypothetical protein
MKYIIEGNINFYDELYKSLDEMPNNNETETCLITNLPLSDNFVTLNCNHKFNYDPLYKEIYNQKIKLKTYDFNLSKNERDFLIKMNKNYYIKCPYCRNIQFDLLPDLNNELLYPKVYGINTTNRAYIKEVEDSRAIKGFMYKGYFYDFSIKNKCNVKDCKNTICAFEPTFKIYFCKIHMQDEIKKKKQEIKYEQIKKIKEQKEQIKQEKLKIKEEEKLLKKNARLSSKKVNNSVIKTLGQIDTYFPENESQPRCISVLKTGVNKGNMCGAKIFMDQCCKRHYTPIINDTNNNALSLVDMKELEDVIKLDVTPENNM